MYRVIDRCSSGKTHKLLEFAKDNNLIVVCSNPSAMSTKAIRYGITGLDFMSYEGYIENIDKQYPVAIDELEKFMLYLSKNISGYTLSVED